MPKREDGRRLLVTGGAGYVGSHVALRLVEAGHEVVVYDNLSSGHRFAVLGAELIVGDLGDRAKLEGLLARRPFDAVLHFAAHIKVDESVADPVKYYRNNTVNALGLFELAAQYGIERIVLSSTAAVYGEPDVELIDEDMPLAPINPYGASKMMAERLLMDIGRAHGLSHAILRYFNVAGADAEARIGQATPDSGHLIKRACETALGLHEALVIHGTDYPTKDGTCIRDYIHVEDLADAHLQALEHLLGGGDSFVANCGYGHGYSVHEVIEAARRVTGVAFEVREGPRRPGDPARLVAANARIRDLLGWRPRRDDLEQIVASAWRWERRLQEMRARAAAAA